jgi:hypothetical protein
MNEVDRFRPLVDALRDCLGGSADDLILLGRQAQSLIAATSAEAPAMQVRLTYSRLFDVLKSMRMQSGAGGLALAVEQKAFVRSLANALKGEIAEEQKLRAGL